MKLLYSGGSACDEATLKRLMLVGTELVFMDRPSVTFGDWGTVGHQSIFRSLDSSGEPVTFEVCAPPSGPADRVYKPYVAADLDGVEFTETVVGGLGRDEHFASKFIQKEGMYGAELMGKTMALFAFTIED